jgi:uncharacterized protein (TIGR03437 family)
MRAGCFVVFLAALRTYGQFYQLAVTDDGEQIYFVSNLGLKTEPQRLGGIYRIVEGRVEAFVQDPPSDLSSMLFSGYDHPQVSGDGQVVVYTKTISCRGGSSCDLRGYPRSYSSVCARGECLDESLGGGAQISRNGRYVLRTGSWAEMPNPPIVFRHVRDLQTGEEVEVPVWPSNDRQALTSDGRVLGVDPEQSGALLLWSRQGLLRLPLAEDRERAVISDTGDWVIYETRASLRSLELSTGRDILLARRGRLPFQMSISNDARLVLYLAQPAPGQVEQIFLTRPDGTQTRQLAQFPEGVTEAVLTGSGRAVIAVTTSGRMVRLSVESGSVEELIARTPIYWLGSDALFSAGFNLIPGSILPVRGEGMASSTRVAPYPLPRELDGVRLLADGEPLPLLSVSPKELWFQVPFELRDPGRPVRFELENSSVFEGGFTSSLRVVRRWPYFFFTRGWLSLAHQDFGALVTRSDPVRPGEVVHAYAVGLGPVTPEMPTGWPTPTDQLFRLVDAFDCRGGNEALEILFAGLAPGMISIYQVSVRMPERLPSQDFLLDCGFSDNARERHGGTVPVPSQLP